MGHREAVEFSLLSDSPSAQGSALSDLAEVLTAAGQAEGATEALEQAPERYEQKENLAMVAQVQPRLEVLRAGASP